MTIKSEEASICIVMCTYMRADKAFAPYPIQVHARVHWQRGSRDGQIVAVVAGTTRGEEVSREAQWT